METPLEGLETTQDLVAFRRIVAWDLKNLADAVKQLESERKPPPPWWLPALFAILLTMAGGWIGLVQKALNDTHRELAQRAEENRKDIDRISAIQSERTGYTRDVEDLKRRVATNEALSQRIPSMEGQLRDMNQKLDRLIERR